LTETRWDDCDDSNLATLIWQYKFGYINFTTAPTKTTAPKARGHGVAELREHS